MNIPQKGTLAYGAWNALHNALRVQKGERVLVISDAITMSVGDAFFDQAFKLTGRPPHFFHLEEFGRPLQEYPHEIREIVPHVDVSVYVASGQKDEYKNFRAPFLNDVVTNNVRHGHGISINERIVLDGLHTDFADLNNRCDELYARLHGARSAHIAAPAGTDVTVDFSSDIPWVLDNAVWLPRQWRNIPAGEVFTAPHNTNGIVVVDGLLGDYFDTRYGPLVETPMTWRIKDNYVIDVSCQNKKLENEFRTYITGHKNNAMMGELGIGALDTKGLVGSMLQDEKLRGTIHLAVGDNLAEHTGGVWNGADTHCDGLVLRPTLTLSNGDVVIKDGVYQRNA